MTEDQERIKNLERKLNLTLTALIDLSMYTVSLHGLAGNLAIIAAGLTPNLTPELKQELDKARQTLVVRQQELMEDLGRVVNDD